MFHCGLEVKWPNIYIANINILFESCYYLSSELITVASGKERKKSFGLLEDESSVYLNDKKGL